MSKEIEVRVKYFEGARRLGQIAKGNWIDVYSNEDVFIQFGKLAKVKLGFALELPDGYEANLLPRSSTCENWGVMLTNEMGIIDTTFCGDNDQWKMSLICVDGKCLKGGDGVDKHTLGTWIHKGDKIGQFRIIESMPKVKFKEVEYLGNKDRGGFGSTGTR